MAAIGAAILAALISALGYIVVQALITASVGVVTYTGIQIAMDWLGSSFFGAAGGLPPEVLGLLGVLKVGTSFSILMSAITMKFTMAGIKGSVSKFKVK